MALLLSQLRHAHALVVILGKIPRLSVWYTQTVARNTALSFWNNVNGEVKDS